MFVRSTVHNNQISALQEKMDAQAMLLRTINSHVATIEFDPAGNIIDANQRFLDIMGYSKDDLAGQHHRLFCLGNYSSSKEYAQFWQSFEDGQSHTQTFQRVKASGESVWLEATYMPVMSEGGKLHSVFKIAYDVTEQVIESKIHKAVNAALDLSMAVIEFEPDGTIIWANSNFLDAVKYTLKQVSGQHHRIFCTDTFLEENRNFWPSLAQGKHAQGLFERLNSNGESVWLEASYNPIFDNDGRVFKVIKFASDVTQQVKEKQMISHAAELSFSTAEETAQIAQQGFELLNNSVNVSHQTVNEVDTTDGIMGRLSVQSGKIEEIVSTIRSIADQTNLLALNAAIEAARAGDQGRGFAVVADEVRQLASRTSSSTVEIESVVVENKQLSQTASDQMRGVKSKVEETNAQISQVTEVMREIHNGALNVTKSVSAILK